MPATLMMTSAPLAIVGLGGDVDFVIVGPEASLVLGVPIPDRVNGQPNKGRIRITQQRVTPEAEQAVLDAVEEMGRAAGRIP